MKKSEIKDGMFVLINGGQEGVVVGGKIIYRNGEFDYLRDWNEDMRIDEKYVFDGNKPRDIIAVYNANSFNGMIERYCIWRRSELDRTERRYLRLVIAPFREQVKSICKVEIPGTSGSECYIRITFKNNDKACLPNFCSLTMYKNMMMEHEYSLEDLGL